MPFTDDELKWFKDSDKTNPSVPGLVRAVRMNADVLSALLERLEAAEWVAERFVPLQDDPTPEEIRKIQEWRKAAGK